MLLSRLLSPPQTRSLALASSKIRDISCSAAKKAGAEGGKAAKKRQSKSDSPTSPPSPPSTPSSSSPFNVVEAASSLSLSPPPAPFNLAAPLDSSSSSSSSSSAPQPLLHQLFALRGARVVITGGGGAIGSSLALGFASAGAAGVAIVDRDGAAARRAAADANAKIGKSGAQGGACTTKIVAIEADATVTSQVDAAVAAAASEFGGTITTLVASVGALQSPGKGPQDMTDEEWERSISVNAGSVFKAARACYPFLKANNNKGNSSSSSSISSSSPSPTSTSPPPTPSSSVVVLGSIAGRFGYGQQSSYCAAKGAALSLARSLAVAWAPAGVRVNVVSPGPTASQFTAPVLSDAGRVRATIESIPSGRLAVPEDFVGPVLFLAGAGARFVTGAEVVVDGGATAHTAVAPAKPAH